MRYQLREDLSCCAVDGCMIFLDIAQDRYFKLTQPLENAMRCFQAHEGVAYPLLENLAAAGLLVKTSDDLEARAGIANIQRPSRSAIEQASMIGNRRLSMTVIFEVTAIVWSTRRQLRTRAFKANLDDAGAYRDRETGTRDIAKSTALEDNLLRVCWQFARARRYVPVEPTCLLDSLSLLRFLSRRGLSANIVLGVTSKPFAAHCWVQAGDMVLNETLSDAHAYAPIRVV